RGRARGRRPRRGHTAARGTDTGGGWQRAGTARGIVVGLVDLQGAAPFTGPGAGGPTPGSLIPVRSRPMGQGISEVLPFAIGIAISPVPIIAIILILFSERARVNGPTFLLGWVIGLAAVSVVVYLVTDAANASTDATSSDTVSWGKIVLGVVLLGLARRNWAKRPKDGQPAALPKWM